MTHVNAYRQDVEDAKHEVAKVLGEAWAKVDALVAKLDSDYAEAPVATPATPVVPDTTPVAPQEDQPVVVDPEPATQPTQVDTKETPKVK